MQQPENTPPHGPDGREEIDTSTGYEQSDVGVTGILVFLTALSIFVVVAGILSYGLGKALNARMNKEDGPTDRWTRTVDVRELGNLPNNPELQHKVAALTETFPTPRIQTDDGNQDVADLHAREDLLLNNYSWVDRAQGRVRIPIDRAMELLAERGLPVATAREEAPLMAGDNRPQVTAPLTDGFARTAYELDQAATRAAEAARQSRSGGTRQGQ